jgi:hypothetical protein
MKFINQKYEQDGTSRSDGRFPWTLISESNIDFGDGREQLSAMGILFQQGLLECVDIKTSRHVEMTSKIRPSLQGLKSTKRDWMKVLEIVTKAIAEGAVKGLSK